MLVGPQPADIFMGCKMFATSWCCCT